MAFQKLRQGDRLAWAHNDIFQAGLDPFTGWVYLNLACRADANGKAWPRQETIAADCGMSERQVRRCVATLVERRLLVVLEQPGRTGGRRSIYYLPTRNEWVAEQLAKHPQPDCESGLQLANRTVSPVQPDCESGSLYKGTTSKELNPKKGAAKPAREKKIAKIDPKKFLAEFPVEFRHDDAFVEAWSDWGEMRIEKKKPLTERAAKLAMKTLVELPLPKAIQTLERSTLSSWTGLFPENVGKGGKSDKFSQASDAQPEQDFGF